MERGEPGGVLALRKDFQRIIGDHYRQAIEDLTGRKVVAFLSETSLEPDITVEIFFMDSPLEGFGTGENGNLQDGRHGPVDRRSNLPDRRRT